MHLFMPPYPVHQIEANNQKSDMLVCVCTYSLILIYSLQLEQLSYDMFQ